MGSRETLAAGFVSLAFGFHAPGREPSWHPFPARRIQSAGETNSADPPGPRPAGDESHR